MDAILVTSPSNVWWVENGAEGHQTIQATVLKSPLTRSVTVRRENQHR
jgi:hypothetical protein